MLAVVEEVTIGDPVYLEKDYTLDDGWLVQLRAALIEQGEATVELGDGVHLSNRNKSVGAQLAVDIERMLNHELTDVELPAVLRDERGRGYLREGSVRIATSGSAGLSYGAFCNAA